MKLYYHPLDRKTVKSPSENRKVIQIITKYPNDQSELIYPGAKLVKDKIGIRQRNPNRYTKSWGGTKLER